MSTSTRILTLRLKEGWWRQIQQGLKSAELRLNTPFFRKQLIGREYDEIHLWLGYPPKTDTTKRMRFAWRGVADLPQVIHPHFGPQPVDLLAIDLSAPIEIPKAEQQSLL
ncbi:MAG: ASCH domain-containing protein [Verrucomicrobiaceae bacterium]|nr:ASCH domain-containing protein [Verrucomicrobiaceae bacterium]